MSVSTENTRAFSADVDPAIYQQYRSVSALSVLAMILGLMSFTTLLTIYFLPVPIAAIVVGIVAVKSVRKNRETQTGTVMAVCGSALATILLISGLSLYVWEEYLSLPEGYEPVAFGLLQEEPGVGQTLPDSALDLDGKQILLRGYVYPHSQKRGLQRFVLVPDFDTCCFGGQPKLTDMVEVKLAEPLRIDFSFNRRKIGGVLKVHPDLKRIEDLTGVYYELEGTYID